MDAMLSAKTTLQKRQNWTQSEKQSKKEEGFIQILKGAKWHEATEHGSG